MTIDSTTFTQDMLSDPAQLMSRTIAAMEEADTTGMTAINDPNNGFVMQWAGAVSLFSKFSEKVDYTNAFYYRQRAVTSEQLYAHLSQFDYVKLMASPATLPFTFAMSKDWIVGNAVDYDATYRKIQIPSTSYITLGGYTYSMYYPIDILVNRNTGAVSAFYNTAVTNGLYSLDSNILLDSQSFYRDGLNWFTITFNMFQFTRSITPYSVQPEQGFNKTISYSDQFYAVKVFSIATDGTRTELAYSLDTMYYDYTTPTVLISVLTDTSQLKLQIPQIYFDNNQIAKNLSVEVYTTKGEINLSISSEDLKNISANFDTGSSSYAAPLDQMPSYALAPTTIDVSGGSNASTYAEIRKAIVNNSLYTRAPITLPELTEAFASSGFTPTRYIDDVTDRVYFATNTLTDTNGMIVPTFTGNILIKGDALSGNPSTIINYSDGFYTILPTTVFSTTTDSTTVTPITDGRIAYLNSLTGSDLVDTLNNSGYVRQPFHITLYTTSKSPSATVYNLMAPKMTNLVFIREHPYSAPQMSVVACQVTHQNDGTGGYLIAMSVGRSENIASEDITNFRVILTCKNKIGNDVYIPASYNGVDNNGNDVWSVVLSTNYHISADDYLTVNLYDSTNTLNSTEIPLTHNFTVLSCFLRSFDTSISPDSTLNGLLPTYFNSSLIVMSQQTLTLQLGQNLSSSVYSGVNTSWGNPVYATAPENIYYLTNQPIFQMNENGVIETRRNSADTQTEVVTIYNIGDTPSSSLDITLTTTAAVDSVAVIPVTDTTGVLVGAPIRGLNIPVGTTVEAKTALSVTLSQPLSGVLPKGSGLIVTNNHFLTRTTAAQTSAGVQLTVASTAGYLPGMTVLGFDIVYGSTIVSVDSETTFTISNQTSAAVASGTLLTIINKTVPGVIRVAKGSVLTDASGTAIIEKPAANQFLIPAILVDGRLFASSATSDQTIVNTLPDKLATYAAQISTLAAGLPEVSNVYYKPTRTMGNATFGIGNSDTIRMSLEMSFEMTVYVPTATNANQTALNSISDSITTILNDQVQNPTIALSEIGEYIQTTLGTAVSAVEMTKLNGSESIRLVALQDSDCKPCVGTKLEYQSDGTILRKPAITITFVSQPDTATTITNTSN